MAEKYDIFIAYHGNAETGSERKAREIYKYIQGKEIYRGKQINAYFHPETNPYGRFLNTPEIIYNTPMFLLVANPKIRRDVNGLVCQTTEDGDMGYLHEEIEAFQNRMYRKEGGKNAVHVFVSDGLGYDEAQALHPIFGGKAVILEAEEVVKCVTDFYRGAYIERFYKEQKDDANNNDKFDKFKEGLWVPEANVIFDGLGDERVGRCLLLYYIEQAKLGDSYAKQCIIDMCDKLQPICIEEKTKKLMFFAKKYI